MSLEKYSWDDDNSGEPRTIGGQDDPWSALMPSYAQPQTPAPPAATAPPPTATNIFDPSYRQTGYGTPESGLGEGGVNNPAYTGPGSPSYMPPGGTVPPPPTPPGGGGATTPRSNVDGNFFLSLVNGKPPSPQTLHAMEGELAQHGISILRNARGWADKIRLPDGTSYDVIEAATANGGKRWQLLPDAGGVDGTARGLMSSLSADGHDVKSVGFDRLMIDGRPYTIKAAPQQPDWQPTWQPGEKLYTPGEITTDDLEGYGYQDVQQRLQTPVAGATDDLALSIIQNPEALSEQMVDTLKARRADEIAGMAKADEDALLRYGYDNNIADSRWLASERQAGQYARDRSLLGSNQEIDIKAAETRMDDRRQAAALGLDVSGEQRARETLANDTGLRSAALRGDRLALREQIAQKAADLQIDQNQVIQNWVIAKMDDMTRRWGIEVQADLDITRLSMQSAQFQEDLMFKLSELDQRMSLGYAELEQDDRQFGADFGLRAAEQQRKTTEKP